MERLKQTRETAIKKGNFVVEVALNDSVANYQRLIQINRYVVQQVILSKSYDKNDFFNKEITSHRFSSWKIWLAILIPCVVFVVLLSIAVVIAFYSNAFSIRTRFGHKVADSSMNVYIVQNPSKNPAFISRQSDLPPSYSKGNKRCLSSVIFITSYIIYFIILCV